MARKPIYKSASKKRAPNRGAFKKITISEQEKEFVREEFSAISADNIDRLSDGARQYYYSLKGAKSASVRLYINPLSLKRVQSIARLLNAANPDLPAIETKGVSLKKIVRNNPRILHTMKRYKNTEGWYDDNQLMSNGLRLKFSFKTKVKPIDFIVAYTGFCVQELFAVRVLFNCEVDFFSNQVTLLVGEVELGEMVKDYTNNEPRGFTYEEAKELKKWYEDSGNVIIITSDPNSEKKIPKSRPGRYVPTIDPNATILDL